jgi:hypothetical protein
MAFELSVLPKQGALTGADRAADAPARVPYPPAFKNLTVAPRDSSTAVTDG